MSKLLRASLAFLISAIILFIPVAFVSALHAVVIEDNAPSALGADVSVGSTFQRDTFYASGRAWVFYVGYDIGLAPHVYYRSSTNGVAWLAKTEFCDVVDANEFSLFWDGTFIHTTWVDNGGVNNGVNYRRGTPNSDGTITWAIAQGVAVPSAALVYRQPTITAYEGRPYIAYGYMSGATPIWAATSSNQTDGTWLPDLDFQNADLTFSNLTEYACLDILSDGIVHVTINSMTACDLQPSITSVRYTDSWQSYENITIASPLHLCSTIVYDTYVNTVYVETGTNTIYHRQSAPGGTWELAPVAQEISGAGVYQMASVSLWNTSGDLKCFFGDGVPGNIAWKHYEHSTGTWDVGFFELVACVTDRFQTAINHWSPLGVVFEDTDGIEFDVTYYDYLDSFPSSPTPLSATEVNFIVILILIVFVIGGILAILEWARKGISGGELAQIVIIVVVGVIVCMAIWLAS